ncbi:MAG: hypothetical protein H6581_14255 [Bacteroidia bacterium]|nr:hypothetical protein [Bacteroidia bacterium]
MKIFKTVLTASLITLLATASFAANGGGKGTREVARTQATKEAKNDLFTQLKKEISYKDFATLANVEGKVYVNFAVNEDGSIEVINASGTTPALTSHVRNALNGAKVDARKSVTGKEFTTKFDFYIVQ